LPDNKLEDKNKEHWLKPEEQKLNKKQSLHKRKPKLNLMRPTKQKNSERTNRKLNKKREIWLRSNKLKKLEMKELLLRQPLRTQRKWTD